LLQVLDALVAWPAGAPAPQWVVDPDADANSDVDADSDADSGTDAGTGEGEEREGEDDRLHTFLEALQR
jgi:hypothetical protein